MHISDWSSDVCSSDLRELLILVNASKKPLLRPLPQERQAYGETPSGVRLKRLWIHRYCAGAARAMASMPAMTRAVSTVASFEGKSSSAGCSFSERSEEHTSELQSLMRTTYAAFCLKK